MTCLRVGAWVGIGMALCAALACASAPRATLQPAVVSLDPALNHRDVTATQLGIARGQPRVIHVFTTYSLSALADLDLIATLPPTTVLGVTLDLDGAPAVAAWRDATLARHPVISWEQWAALAAPFVAANTLPLVPTTWVIAGDGAVVFTKHGQLTASDLRRIRALAR